MTKLGTVDWQARLLRVTGRRDGKKTAKAGKYVSSWSAGKLSVTLHATQAAWCSEPTDDLLLHLASHRQTAPYLFEIVKYTAFEEVLARTPDGEGESSTAALRDAVEARP